MVDSFTTRAFVEKCQNVLSFSDNRRIDEYYYTSLPFCILDAVFSIGAHYRTTEKVVERYAKFCGMNRYTFENQTVICTVQRFIEDFEKEETIGLFAKNVLCNRQRTSPRNGILKAEASYQIAKILHGYCVDTLTDFRNLSEEKLTEVSKQLLAVRGQGSQSSERSDRTNSLRRHRCSQEDPCSCGLYHGSGNADIGVPCIPL